MRVEVTTDLGGNITNWEFTAHTGIPKAEGEVLHRFRTVKIFNVVEEEFGLLGLCRRPAGCSAEGFFDRDEGQTGPTGLWIISSVPDTPIPEPSTLLLLGSGLAGLGFFRMRRKREA